MGSAEVNISAKGLYIQVCVYFWGSISLDEGCSLFQEVDFVFVLWHIKG